MTDWGDHTVSLPVVPSLDDDTRSEEFTLNETGEVEQLPTNATSSAPTPSERMNLTTATATTATTPSLSVATSYDDSETEIDYFSKLTTEPFYGLKPRLSERPPTVRQDSIDESIEPKEAETFDVADDSDFEILDDDDDDGREEDDNNVDEEDEETTKRKLHRRNQTCPSALEVPRKKNQVQKYDTPPRSPPRSPSTGSPQPDGARTPPLTPQRRLLNRLHMATLSPKREQQQEESSETTEMKEKTNKFRFLAQAAAELKSPLPTLKMLRARAMAKNKDRETTDVELDEDVGSEGSSSGESSYDDDISFGDDSTIFEDDENQTVDFSTLDPLPNSFLDLAPDIHDYLDFELVKNIAAQDISTLAWEHHLFVKGLLQLLAERDHVGVEGDIHDTSNVIKMGPLKKKSRQSMWLVKYVEIRKGNLTYYADNMLMEGSSDRKTIHLRKRTCSCQAVEKDSSSNNFVFELLVQGGGKTLWMAKSEDERQGWIRAINQAMIGETEDSQDSPLDMDLYKNTISAYQSVQSSLQEVKTHQDYRVAVDALLYRQRSSSALRVPTKWLRSQVEEEEEEKGRKKPENADARVRSTISDFWRSLLNTTVVINGYVVEANTPYSAERVLGALSRCILEFDRMDGEQGIGGVYSKPIKRSDRDSFINEVEAVSYARSILTGVLRSKSRGYAFAAVEKLVRNDDVVSVQIEGSEPLHIDISFAGDDFSEYEPQPYDLTGWVKTKLRKHKTWKERYFVLSEGVLSYFEKADPRPSGLRGQLVLGESKVKTTDERILQIQTKDEERQLSFEDRGSFVKWRSILERAVDSQSGFESGQDAHNESLITERRKRTPTLAVSVKPLKDATEAGVKAGMRAMKAVKDAKSAGMKSIKNARGMFNRRTRAKNDQSHSASRRRPTSDMLFTSTRILSQAKGGRREPTVQAVVELNSVFKVMPTATSTQKDALLVVRVKLYQAFLLSGGVSGRLARGDELLEMEFFEGDGLEAGDHEFLEAPTVL